MTCDLQDFDTGQTVKGAVAQRCEEVVVKVQHGETPQIAEGQGRQLPDAVVTHVSRHNNMCELHFSAIPVTGGNGQAYNVDGGRYRTGVTCPALYTTT